MVEYVGKNRKNRVAVGMLNDSGLKLNENVFFPDAYKVTMNIKDLAPNNFNMYLAHLMEDKVSISAGEIKVNYMALFG